MKILAFSPFDADSLSGNAVTLRRIRAALASRGHGFAIVTVAESTTLDDARKAVRRASPDVVHFYHSYKTGRLLPGLGATPSVLTLSGTDINRDYEDPDRRAVIEEAVAGAGAVVTYSRSLAARFSRPVRIIPKGVTLGAAPFDLRGASGIAASDFVFLQAGGIRPVKNNLFAVEVLASLQKSTPSIRLVLAGPVLDPDYGHEVARRVATASWIRHLPLIPPDAMHAAYRGADVVLNTSTSEGLSNALMEAMASGSCILAADVPGNRDLLSDGRTALLYRDRNDFQDKAALLYRDRPRREALGRAAKADAAARFSADREADALLETYSEALKKR